MQIFIALFIYADNIIDSSGYRAILFIHNFVMTVCGERGTGLSEGQAQRICIARGLLRQGSILLLDEFSSSLDTQTERLFMERLIAQTKDKTLLFITHREMVAEYCEQIIKWDK